MVNKTVCLFFIRYSAFSLHRVITIDHNRGRSMFTTLSYLDLIFMMVTELIPVGCVVTGVTTIDHSFILLDLRSSRLIVHHLFNVRHLNGADRNGRQHVTIFSSIRSVSRRLCKILVLSMLRTI